MSATENKVCEDCGAKGTSTDDCRGIDALCWSCRKKAERISRAIRNYPHAIADDRQRKLARAKRREGMELDSVPSPAGPPDTREP